MNSEFCVAVHALVYLKHMNRLLSSEELADNICTNPARVRKVMARLKYAGLVSTREGAVGGYKLSGEGDITLRQVAEAMATPLVDTAWRSGDHDKACLISSGMAGFMDDMIEDLNELCKKRLENRTIFEIERELLSKGHGGKKNEEL